jgi:sulfatase modifying factor 1
MGCSPGDPECHAEEKPAHRVFIARAFELGKYLVTQEQYEEVTVANRRYSGGPNLPVAGVSWDDAQSFCAALNGKRDGYHYRLPTEAEWEYAARAGDSSCRYGPLVEVAWSHDNSDGKAHPVGEKKPNGFGLYDTLGNLWEWVQDWYGENYYSHSPESDPTAESIACRAAAPGAELPEGLRASPLATPSSPLSAASWSGSAVHAKWSPELFLFFLIDVTRPSHSKLLYRGQ